MFEILKALMALQHAARDHDRDMRWRLEDDPGMGMVLRAEVYVTEDDTEFVRQMQKMFEPAPDTES